MSDGINHNSDHSDKILSDADGWAREHFGFQVASSTLPERLAAVQQLFGGQAQMSEAIGMSVSGIKAWISRGTEPGLLKIAAIATKTGVSLDYLASGSIRVARDLDAERARLEQRRSTLQHSSLPERRQAVLKLLQEATETIATLGRQFETVATSAVATEAARPIAGPQSGPATSETIELVGAILQRVFRDEHAKLPATALVSYIARYVAALQSKMDDPADIAEARALVPWLENRIKNELKAARAEPGTGKREAS